MESCVEKDVMVQRLLGDVEDLEVPASGPCTVQWRNRPVEQRSSNWGGGGGLSSTRRDDNQRRRPRRPNLLGG